MGVFLAVARSLGRRGLEVHVAPADPADPGLASRYIAQVHVLPPYHRDPAAWLRSLKALIAANDYRLIIPCNDSRMLILRHHAGEIGRDILALANDEALDVFTDKAATRALASRLGVRTARGRIIDDPAGAAALADEFGLPLVLKPAVTHEVGGACEKVMARIVRDRAVLAEMSGELERGAWIAESFVPGEGIGVSVLARGGDILMAVQHRRLAVGSETGGSTARRTEPVDPYLLADAASLARETRLNGVAMFEFRMDRTTGRYALLEVNPRFWGSLPLAVAARADFPALLYDILSGGDPRIPARSHRLLTKRSLTGEFDRLTDLLNTAPPQLRIWAAFSLLSLVAGLVPRDELDSWAKDDPEPFRAERSRIRARAAERCRRLLRPAPRQSLTFS